MVHQGHRIGPEKLKEQIEQLEQELEHYKRGEPMRELQNVESKAGTAAQHHRDLITPAAIAAYGSRSGLRIVCEYTQSESFCRHMLAVEAALRAYARRNGEDVEKWGVVGLLHDFD